MIDPQERLIEIACETLGHEKGPLQLHVDLKNIWRWRACTRCHKILEGIAPGIDVMMRMVGCAAKAQCEEESPFWLKRRI